MTGWLLVPVLLLDLAVVTGARWLRLWLAPDVVAGLAALGVLVLMENVT